MSKSVSLESKVQFQSGYFKVGNLGRFTLKEVEKIIKLKGWNQVSKKVIDDLRAEEVAEVL